MSPCNGFRQREMARIVSDGAGAFRSVPESRCCEACDKWLARQQLWVEATAELAPVCAPAELAGRVELELNGDHENTADSERGSVQVASALRALSRVQAPDELAARLFGSGASQPAEELPVEAQASEAFEESDPLPESRGAQFLRELPRMNAPDVLERLVAEELSSSAAQVRRFVGDLETKRTPPLLWTRLKGSSRGARMRAGGAIAAALLAALAFGLWRGDGSAGPRHSFDFEVVRVDSAASMDPMAQALFTALGGVDLDGRPR